MEVNSTACINLHLVVDQEAFGGLLQQAIRHGVTIDEYLQRLVTRAAQGALMPPQSGRHYTTSRRKLSDEQIRDVYRLYTQNEIGVDAIGATFGVNGGMVSLIGKGRLYAHITGATPTYGPTPRRKKALDHGKERV